MGTTTKIITSQTEDEFAWISTAVRRMVPFFKSVILYFVLTTLSHKGTFWSTVLKCAPIGCLMLFITFYGINIRERYTYVQKILLGLVFSCLGDALLNFNMFAQGMGAFAVTQICYISAFGFTPLNIRTGCFLYALTSWFLLLVYKRLDDILVVGVPIYCFLLTTMCWRAVVQATNNKNTNRRIIDTIRATGSILFVISDSCIAIDKFYLPFPRSTTYIMITYYAAQFAITLSIVPKPELAITGAS